MRTQINAASFSAPETEKLFRDFIDWLTNNVGPEKSAQTQNRYAEFFKAIQYFPMNWPSDVFYLAALDGGFLRKSSKPRLYLESIGVRFDAGALKDAMNLRTINNNLVSIREKCGNEFRAQVDSFFDNRLEEYLDGKTKMLTIRIESSAVMTLFEYAVRFEGIDNALRELAVIYPGLRCSLKAVLNYLSTHNAVTFTFPELDAELRLVYLIKQLRRKKASKRIFEEYIYLCLHLLHPSNNLILSNCDIEKNTNGYYVVFLNANFWIPFD
jgi:hypothetical protein